MVEIYSDIYYTSERINERSTALYSSERSLSQKITEALFSTNYAWNKLTGEQVAALLSYAEGQSEEVPSLVATIASALEQEASPYLAEQIRYQIIAECLSCLDEVSPKEHDAIIAIFCALTGTSPEDHLIL